jgi:RES domain-containing protein
MEAVACSSCFTDRGLRLDAEQLGQVSPEPCPNCGSLDSKKLDQGTVANLAHRFFVWGSFWRTRYGGAPLVQFNEHQRTSIALSPWLKADVALIEKTAGIGFFHYGPRLWMLGEIEPLKDLNRKASRKLVIERIMREYPARTLESTSRFYRIRKDPKSPDNINEYDSPPGKYLGKGRFDTIVLPSLYASPDLEVCIHECRVSAEDELYLATLAPSRPLRILDLAVVLPEERVTEFESLDMALHMLFMAGKHSYKITRDIAVAARDFGYDGLIYPSYFSLLRLGIMPLRTSYGLSHRRIPELRAQEEDFSVPNLAIFGRPVESGILKVECINKLVLNRVAYNFHFGPASV